MIKKICLKDIAEKVGVSTALVSYVLNNKKEGRIKKSVAQRIREVAMELNYHTNQIAKSLKTSKTFTIGLIVADISNPFSSSLARIIEDEADKNNYTVIFGSSDESLLRSNKLVDTFLNRQVDGLIIAPGEDAASQIFSLRQQRIPFVLVDRYFPDIKTNYVALDNYKASCSAIQHLVNCGFKRIGMISLNTPLFNIQERKRGYIDALQNSGINFDKRRLIEIDYDNDKMETSVKNAINILLAPGHPIDALLFATNAIATHGLRHINALQIKVPESLALATFDKTDALDLFYAPITYINQPLQEMGRLATKILLEAIEGNTSITQLNLPAELVIRSSTVMDKKYLPAI
ncbi:MAG: LacI family DNA-binding transcriptional regulator [Ferruginibacter sp.]|nr:LacI family DNA-binding transcriptional regulator [Ferruginibacter sp.]